jgi:chromosome segregation ATPase
MSDDGIAMQLLKDFSKQLQEVSVGIAKISTTQDSIKDKLDAGEGRLEKHEEVHRELNKRIGELESDWDQRTGAQRVGDRISAGAWALLGAGAAVLAGLLPSWLTHK